MFEDVNSPYPTEVVELDDGTGVVEKPLGFFCCAREAGCKKGMPYIPLETIKEMVERSPDIRALCCKNTDIHLGAIQEDISGLDSVQTVEKGSESTDVIYDGFDRFDFMDVHEGMAPESVGIQPIVEKHPVTGTETEVFYVPAIPHWRFTVSTGKVAELQTNQMKDQLYIDQPKDTFNYLSSRKEKFTGSTAPQSRQQVLNAMRQHIAKHGRPKTDQLPDRAASASRLARAGPCPGSASSSGSQTSAGSHALAAAFRGQGAQATSHLLSKVRFKDCISIRVSSYMFYTRLITGGI